MRDTSTTVLPLTIAVISRQHLIWLGLQNMFERAATPRILMHLHPRMMPDALRVEQQPDVFLLDLENERDAVGLIKRIRESAPNSKIVLLGGFEEQEGMREAFAYGVDGVILTVQPPEVVLATIEALYPPGKNRGQAERHETECGGDRKKRPEQKGALETQLPPWPDDVTEREHEVIRLLCQGLSNKEIAFRLSIAHSTVRHHLTNIFEKVGVPNRQMLLIHTHQFRAHPLTTISHG
jgi:DNA-binding NarL/FixJ family response regulator